LRDDLASPHPESSRRNRRRGSDRKGSRMLPSDTSERRRNSGERWVPLIYINLLRSMRRTFRAGRVRRQVKIMFRYIPLLLQ
jgi:hypothetical protein